MLLAGLAATAFSGLALSDTSGQRNETAFDNWVAAAAYTTTLELNRYQDLGVSTAAFLGQASRFTPAALRQWATSVRYPQSYQKISLLFFIRYVPASQLSSYAASLNGGFRLFPPGQHSYYCFIPEGDTIGPGFRIGASGAGLPQAVGESPRVLAGVDLCATVAGDALIPSALSGQPVDAYPGSPGIGLVLRPVYIGGEVPPSTALRRSDLLGWTGVLFDVDATLKAALGGFHRAGLVLLAHNVVQHSVVVGQTGKVGRSPAFSQLAHLGTGSAWTLEASWTPTSGLFGLDVQQGAILLGGVLLTLVAWALLRLMPSARDRALELVAERTAELHRLALQDPLTGLANRGLVLDRVSESLATGTRPASAIAVVFIDLDNFKDINDSLGHSVGDAVLRELGVRLTACVRTEDTVGRLGGDEFIILLVGDSLKESLETLANRILASVRSPIFIAEVDVALEVDASIGIAVGAYSRAGEALRDADIALYQAKRSGKGQFAVFEPRMAEDVQQRRATHLDLQRAFETGEFSLSYRPAVDPATQEVVAMEAVLGWDRIPDTERPQFLEDLEASGLSGGVGYWMLERACEDAVRWNARGVNCAVSVALSASQFARAKFVTDVLAVLERTGLAPDRLILAVPGITLLAGEAESLRRLEALHALGVRLAAANPGYAALRSVRRAPISVLAIDESEAAGAPDEQQAAAFGLARRLLAGVLGMQVTIAGGETVVREGEELHPIGEALLNSEQVRAFLAGRDGVGLTTD